MIGGDKHPHFLAVQADCPRVKRLPAAGPHPSKEHPAAFSDPSFQRGTSDHHETEGFEMTGPSHTTEQSLATSAGGGISLTMSSQEIAEKTGKEHAHVMRDIRSMLKGLGISEDVGQSRFGSTYRDAQGKERACYRLPKRECLTLVSGYSVALRASIIDRWMELESANAASRPALDPSDPKVMLAVFGHLQKQVAEKDEIIAAQGVQVKALERLEGAQGSMCITDAAKTLGVGRDVLISRMQAERWIYKRTGNKNWVAYHDKLMARVLDHDDHIYRDSEGRERVATRALVTAKGLVRLAEILNRPLH